MSQKLMKAAKSKDESVKAEVKVVKPRAKKAEPVVESAEAPSILSQLAEAVAGIGKKPRAKRILTEEQKQALRDRLVVARAAKKSKTVA